METKKLTIKMDHIEVMLFIIFLILKLDGIIDWKWIWIFSPLWILWAIKISIMIVLQIANAIIKIANWQPKYKTHVASGPSLVWDPKTNELYGPWTAEDNGIE